jgi:hypothetical protein
LSFRGARSANPESIGQQTRCMTLPIAIEAFRSAQFPTVDDASVAPRASVELGSLARAFSISVSAPDCLRDIALRVAKRADYQRICKAAEGRNHFVSCRMEQLDKEPSGKNLKLISRVSVSVSKKYRIHLVPASQFAGKGTG